MIFVTGPNPPLLGVSWSFTSDSPHNARKIVSLHTAKWRERKHFPVYSGSASASGETIPPLRTATSPSCLRLFPLKRHDNPRSFQSARSACRPRLPEARRIVKFGQAIARIWQRWSDAAPAGLWFAYSVSWECALLPFERAVVLARGAEKP
jgi:hypothetical protein